METADDDMPDSEDRLDEEAESESGADELDAEEVEEEESDIDADEEVDEVVAAEEEPPAVSEPAPPAPAEPPKQPRRAAMARGASDESAESTGKTWYVLKVQSNREDTIRDAIMKRIKIEGLEEYIEDIVVPTEKVTEIKSGKKRVMERKFYPGYIMIKLELNDDVWFVIRETPGVGDFVGAGGKPVAMTEQDVAKMLGRKEEVEQAAPRLKISFQKGDRVKIKEGTFENFEGDVDDVIEAKGLVRVMIQIFGRPTPVELEYWQVEPV